METICKKGRLNVKKNAETNITWEVHPSNRHNELDPGHLFLMRLIPFLLFPDM
jgi:hypothetical protein